MAGHRLLSFPDPEQRNAAYPGPLVDDLDGIRKRVAAYTPRAKPDGHRSLWAATALVIAPGESDEPQAAFIQRPTRDNDRWSGQMALPGGKRDPDDAGALAAAVRETREEIGVALGAPHGRLDDVRGLPFHGSVATYVFVLDDRPALHPDPHEVAAALWIPVPTLFAAEAAFRYSWGGFRGWPAIRHGEHVIWGLTHRILGSFAHALGVRLPPAGR
jgi:8-oxo-dGTP pyrophosphatase MutT (NUDIX family)